MRQPARKQSSRTSVGKSAAARSKASKSSPHSFGLVADIFGWIAVVFVCIAVTALLSRATGGNKVNWLGPYIGDAFAKNLNSGLGSLPSMLFILALGLTGFKLLVRNALPALWRVAFGLWSVFFFVDILLSLRIDDFKNILLEQLEHNGGLLGVFLVRQLVEPVFSTARLGPVLVCVAGLLLTFIVAFGLRPKHLAPAWAWCVSLFSKFSERSASQTKVTEPVDAPIITHLHRNEDTSDFPVMRRGQVHAYAAENAPLSAPLNAPEPLQAQALPVQALPVQAPVPVSKPQSPLLDPSEHNVAIRQIEALLANHRNMDPREVRRLRDELVDLRRVSEVNNWEDRKAGELRIEGIVKPSETQAPKTLPTPVAPKSAKPALIEADTVVNEPIKPAPKVVEVPHAVQVAAVQHVEAEPRVQMPPVFQPREEELFQGHSGGEYALPRVGAVLGEVPVQPVDYSQDELKQFGSMLEQQLENFRVKGKVVQIATGPVITRFEIEPGPGVKVSRFASLSDDLALALKAHSIRVLAPIPGKSVVGIEIPNRKAQTVYCREILESPRFTPDPYTLQIVLGKDIMGNAFVMDLARAPHLLIAGQTGSGKSVCINTLMASLLFSKTPDDLRMILVDPKVVELKSYENIPHLLHPVVTDPGTAVQALQWACYEMDRRYELLAKAGVRNIAGFNQKLVKGELEDIDAIDSKDKQRMPFIVIIVDEFADVIMQAKKEFEDPVIRLAQKARAAGMHMVLATQRPSTNVITGIIKANLPTRISFKVASHIDARTVLDHAGAEKLLGRGDMLFRSIDDPEPIRVHGAFLTDSDAERVAKSCSEQKVHYPQLSSFLVQGPDSGGDSDPLDGGETMDELFWDAAELCVMQGGGSTSLLQRRFSIGYARAGRIMDALCRAGVVGQARSDSKPRECLMSGEEIANLRRTRGV